jgi:hypothetical protein
MRPDLPQTARVRVQALVTGAGWPLPSRHFPQWVQLIIGLGVTVLHRHLRPELDMRAHRRTKWRVGRKPGCIRCGHVQLHEPVPLRLGDLQAAVHLDQVGEAQLAGEVIRPSERFGLERGQMVHMFRPSRAEQRPQHRIGQHAAVEDIDEVTQASRPPACSYIE